MTIKHILASTALAALLAGGAVAQTTPAADPAMEPAAPAIAPAAPMQGDGATAPVADPATPSVVEDGTVAPDAAAPMTADADWAPVDLATFSTDRLIGANVVTGADETVATVEDVLISDTGTVENIVVKFGGFLGFGENRVLLTMDEIQVMQDADENLMVRTSLTPESIESRPVYG